jgi:2-polyprenyl-3-methyl-5-hydroxy-6-metoxy-1,4-benzoquinol methylase
MADEIFEHPRLAALHDPLDPDRTDLHAYLDLARQLDATRVLDIGCDTGVFALLLADRGVEVVGASTLPAPVSTWPWRSQAVNGCAGSTVTQRPCHRCAWTSSR